MFRKLSAILIILQILFLTGCWSSREINTLAISVCMGIDKVDNGYLLTEQIINPKAIASRKTINEAPVILYSDTGKDIFEMLRKLTTQCPRRIYLSHLRMVIFGEEAAKDGIEGFLDFLARDHEFRTDFYFIIAKRTTANEVLSTLTPLEAIPGFEMYSSLKTSEESWSPTKSIRIVELINSIVADGKNPILTAIEITDGEVDSNSINALKQSNSIKKLKYSGLSAFKKDKLVGWLDEEESKGYNYIIGNVKSSVGYSNYDDNVKLTSEVKEAKSKIKASLVKGKPAIDVEIEIKQNVGAVDGQFDVSKDENKKILNELGEEKIKSICEMAVNKAQTELKADIFGFGEAIHRKYPKQWKKLKNDWNNEFTHIPVNITVKAETKQLGQITKSFFIKEEE